MLILSNREINYPIDLTCQVYRSDLLMIEGLWFLRSNHPGNDDMSHTRRGLPLARARIEQIFPKLTRHKFVVLHHTVVYVQYKAWRSPIRAGRHLCHLLCGCLWRARGCAPFGTVETLVTVHRSGQFTGEVGTLSGRRTMFRVRATKPGKVIELERRHMLTLVQTDAELGEILMRAFILRRAELITAGVGDIVLIGSTYSA